MDEVKQEETETRRGETEERVQEAPQAEENTATAKVVEGSGQEEQEQQEPAEEVAAEAHQEQPITPSTPPPSSSSPSSSVSTTPTANVTEEPTAMAVATTAPPKSQSDHKRSMVGSPSTSSSSGFKRHKRSASPSKVLHIRNLPPATTEEELISLVNSFGAVTNLLLMAGKGQAFIQMDSIEASMNVISYYSLHQPSVRGRNVFFQHSTRKEIVVEPSRSTAAPNKILLCSILDVRAPITIDNLERVFSVHGTVLRIVTFVKNGYHALIEMGSVEQAGNAMAALDGQDLVIGCCTLKIQYSTLEKLNVNANNARSRDYTLYPSNSGSPAVQSYPRGSDAATFGISGGGGYPPVAYSTQPTTAMPSMEDYSGSPKKDLGAYGQQTAALTGASPSATGAYPQAATSAYTQAAPGAYVPQVFPNPAAYGATAQQAAAFATAFPQPAVYPQPFPTSYHQHPSYSMQVPREGRITLQRGGVLLVSNINPQYVDCQTLFRLFGVYGDVYRVKILYNKRDTALVQLANHEQAEAARIHLNDAVFFGKQLNIVPSKHPEVQLPRNPDQTSESLTKDFAESKEHRFKMAGSKNFKNICAPNATLHISNMPGDITDDELRENLSKHADIEAIQFFKTNRSMALVRVGSVDLAMQFLVACHNMPIGGKNIKITFSKKPID